MTLVLLFVLRRDFAAGASDAMSSWRIASTFEISLSFASANERLVACWAVRRRRSVSTSALRLSASSGWPEAVALNAGDPEREPPRVLASRMFVERLPAGRSRKAGRFPYPFNFHVAHRHNQLSLLNRHSAHRSAPRSNWRSRPTTPSVVAHTSGRRTLRVKPMGAIPVTVPLGNKRQLSGTACRCMRQERLSPAAPPNVGLMTLVN